MAKDEELKKPKKIMFSEDIDSKISGFSIAFAFIAIGIFLTYDQNYFGNELLSTIIRWIFIGIGAIGLCSEWKKGFKSEIKGISTFMTGAVLIAIWLILYLSLSSSLVNLIAFFFLMFGLYGSFRGIFEIGYSIKELLNAKKKEKSNILTDVLLLMTTILGLILVVMQLLLEILPE